MFKILKTFLSLEKRQYLTHLTSLKGYRCESRGIAVFALRVLQNYTVSSFYYFYYYFIFDFCQAFKQRENTSIYVYKIVIYVCLSVCLSDHNSGTPGPICLKF